MGADSLFVGQRVIRLDQVDSTNSFTLGILKGMQVEEGLVVTSARQTRGRGQRGNSWESEPGKNITCSIVLKPSFLDPHMQFELTRVASLALSDMLRDIIPHRNVNIKWPNDIYVDGKKIAGILIENAIVSSRISYSVIGIGMNVNQETFGVTGNTATSLKLLSGTEYDLNNLLKMLCAAIEVRYLQLRAGKPEKLRREYFERLFLAGEFTRYTDFARVFEARITEVTDEGFLVLELTDGTLRRFAMKEVGWVGNEL
jgi:BirA family transcriptional regulator, biotin operon repressor / biotin---[acetyl-CoA-carboxylase] ligase